ncbi:MAG: hypothetical protein QOD95_3296, partial [Gammaproteobacteria bacterium]|nr:hypothetical protein [Gammaproteobacteria bacterium]
MITSLRSSRPKERDGIDLVGQDVPGDHDAEIHPPEADPSLQRECPDWDRYQRLNRDSRREPCRVAGR